MTVRKTDPWWVRLLSVFGVDVVTMTRDEATKWLSQREVRVIVTPVLVFPDECKENHHVDGEARDRPQIGPGAGVRDL